MWERKEEDFPLLFIVSSIEGDRDIGSVSAVVVIFQRISISQTEIYEKNVVKVKTLLICHV